MTPSSTASGDPPTAVATTGLPAAMASRMTRLSGSGQTDGVSAHEIRVGGLASITGPLGDQYGPVFDGAQTYFDMVNAQGGVFGRKIKLDARLDDATDPAWHDALAGHSQREREQAEVYTLDV